MVIGSDTFDLRIMGRVIKVTCANLDDDYFGWLSEDAGEIKIQKGLSAADTLDTILHEVLHLIFTLLHVDVKDLDEETIVSISSSVLTALLIENPNFTKMIAFLSESARKQSVPTF